MRIDRLLLGLAFLTMSAVMAVIRVGVELAEIAAERRNRKKEKHESNPD
jgi:hypothetical protein